MGILHGITSIPFSPYDKMVSYLSFLEVHNANIQQQHRTWIFRDNWEQGLDNEYENTM